jgi:uncharacterized membrane protein
MSDLPLPTPPPDRVSEFPAPGDDFRSHETGTPGEQYSEDDADALIGVSFDDVLKAREFLLALNRLSTHGELKLKDAVVVAKDTQGDVRVRETLDPQPGRAALSGAAWSGLLGLILGGPVGWLAGIGIGAGAGAIAAHFVDFGIPDEWVDWFKGAVRPQTATVVVLASDINVEALYGEAERFTGAELLHTTLKPGIRDALTHAFGDDDLESGYVRKGPED